jgi:flagellin
MSSVVNTNVSALFSQRAMNSSQDTMQTAMERLSSGKRINSAADDAAGSAIADRMTSQIKGLDQAIRNSNDTISLVKTAEGAMQETTSTLQRMRELSVQSSSDTNTSADRQYLQKEIALLQQELTRISATTQFNNQNLLDGSFTAKTFLIGANAGQDIRVTIADLSSDNIGSHDLDLTGTARNAVTGADKATVVNTVTAGEDLTVAGHIGTTTVDVLVNNTARDVAALVNGVRNDTGVEATAITKAKLDTVSGVGTYTMNIYGKNTSSPVNISFNITKTADLTNLAEAFNSKAGTTGITAELSADKAAVTLTQAEGYDIVIEDVLETGGSAATINMTGLDQDNANAGAAVSLGAAVGTDTGRSAGSVSFSSAKDYTVKSAAAGGLFALTTSNGSSLTDVASLNITTQVSANGAITVLDGALTLLQDERANLGAIQNRLETTVSNLENISSNISASRSAVEDADFAKESSLLARDKILQQAGTAMLAQANQSMQGVMQLLQ